MGNNRTRRPDGTGSLRKLPSGSWHGRIRLPGTDIRYSCTAKSKAEVHRKLQNAVAQVEQGQPAPHEHLTVGTWLDRWLADVVEPTKEPRTYDTYAKYVRLYLKPAIGKKKLVRLTPGEVQSMLAAMLRSGLSARTVWHARAVLRGALSAAMRYDLVHRNVAKLTEVPTPEQHEVRPLSADHARHILAAVEGTRLNTPCLLALALGMRQSEILGLRWDAVDLDRGELRIERVLTRARERVGGSPRQFELRKPKTPKSRRVIPVPKPIVAALRRQMTTQKEDRLRAGPSWKGGDWNLVCCSEAGGPLDGSDVTHRFQKALYQAGLPHMRFHDLRHGAASFLCSLRVPLPVAMKILGHAHVATLANVYAHAHDDELRAAVEALGELLEV